MHWNSHVHVACSEHHALQSCWECFTVSSGCLQAHRVQSGFVSPLQTWSFISSGLQALIAVCSTVVGFFLCGPLCHSWESTHNSRMTKNRLPFVPPAVLKHFSPQSSSLSLASRLKCKQEVVKYPPWPGRGNHTGPGHWTLPRSAGQLEGSTVNSEKLCYGLLCWTMWIQVKGCATLHENETLLQCRHSWSIIHNKKGDTPKWVSARHQETNRKLLDIWLCLAVSKLNDILTPVLQFGCLVSGQSVVKSVVLTIGPWTSWTKSW